MGVVFIVTTVTSSQHIFDAATFLFQAEQKWPGCKTFIDDPDADVTDAEVNVSPADGPSFTVSHYPDNHMVSIDGNPDNSAEVAAWVRSLHPDPDLILWYTDDGFRGHTALFPGITADQVAKGWIDHQEHDPYKEFPDYFQ